MNTSLLASIPRVKVGPKVVSTEYTLWVCTTGKGGTQQSTFTSESNSRGRYSVVFLPVWVLQLPRLELYFNNCKEADLGMFFVVQVINNVDLIPGLGHKIPYATEKLSAAATELTPWSPCATAREPVCCNERSLIIQEDPTPDRSVTTTEQREVFSTSLCTIFTHLEQTLEAKGTTILSLQKRDHKHSKSDKIR